MMDNLIKMFQRFLTLLVTCVSGLKHYQGPRVSRGRVGAVTQPGSRSRSTTTTMTRRLGCTMVHWGCV